MGDRRRGFERISVEQWEKETSSVPSIVTDYWRYEDITLPQRATKNSAGCDVYSSWSFELLPDSSIMIPTGFRAYMLPDEMLTIYPRGSFGFKYFLRLANTVGIGDSDFYMNEDNEGHYWVKVRNEGSNKLVVKKGDRLAQAIFQPFLIPDNDDVATVRRGGFGHTGV